MPDSMTSGRYDSDESQHVVKPPVTAISHGHNGFRAADTRCHTGNRVPGGPGGELRPDGRLDPGPRHPCTRDRQRSRGSGRMVPLSVASAAGSRRLLVCSPGADSQDPRRTECHLPDAVLVAQLLATVGRGRRPPARSLYRCLSASQQRVGSSAKDTASRRLAASAMVLGGTGAPACWSL